MYAGHLATALALKTVEPRAPTWALAVGAGLLDILFGVFIMAGIESGTAAGFDIPWSHSLLMALLWSALFALPFWRQGARVMTALALAVLSHWVLDVCVHRPDLGLWPRSPVQLGCRAWLGSNSGWFEAVWTLAGCLLYVRQARRTTAHGRYWPVSCVVVALCFTLALGREHRWF